LPTFGNAKLNQLNLERINRYYAKLAIEGRGTRTIRLIHSVLHSAIELTQWGLFPAWAKDGRNKIMLINVHAEIMMKKLLQLSTGIFSV
jgi:hypothetical protein